MTPRAECEQIISMSSRAQTVPPTTDPAAPETTSQGPYTYQPIITTDDCVPLIAPPEPGLGLTRYSAKVCYVDETTTAEIASSGLRLPATGAESMLPYAASVSFLGVFMLAIARRRVVR